MATTTISSAPVVPPAAVTDFRNEPCRDFALPKVREQFQNAIDEARSLFPIEAPVVIGGERIATDWLDVTSPNDTSIVCGRSGMAGTQHVHKAIEAARAAFRSWSRTSAGERAQLLIDIAARVRAKRDLLSALMVFEAGKPWREADADICEGIDFLEYYAREMLRFGDRQVLQPYHLGERNELYYVSLGVVAVIGPWNFPMAIPTGMMAAALVAGNTVLWKPSRQTPLITSLIFEIMEQAGLPPGVVNFVPGSGRDIGKVLLESPDVEMIAFTGSRQVGLHILRESQVVRPGQQFVKRVVAEMGGKNSLIIDETADLDAAILDILSSAFGFSGQKCSALSRLIVHQHIYDDLMPKLREGVESLEIAPAWDIHCQVNPVIDAEARAKIESYIEVGKEEGTPLVVRDAGPLKEKGHYVGPAVFEGIEPRHRLAQEEVFGPVVAVMKARSFNDALDIANSTEYALTGGVYSRTPEHLDRARFELRCGNLYLNRKITGAIVGRQPFGGFKMSGIGSKAGGPDYLRQFLVARACSENLMRRGSGV